MEKRDAVGDPNWGTGPKWTYFSNKEGDAVSLVECVNEIRQLAAGRPHKAKGGKPIFSMLWLPG